MVVNGRPVKRAKRRITADLYDFFSFPSGDLDGPFRSNVQIFLSRHARMLPPPSISPEGMDGGDGRMVGWTVGFGVGEGEGSLGAVEMDVVEEDVGRARSAYCDQCRVVGWSCHPVCRKRYHFIIRNNANPFSSSHQKCLCCGALLQRMDSRCHSCNNDITAENLEDWADHQLEDPTHLLHGLVHSNGYGHLLRVNGRDGGSRYLTGSDIMGFWDRLCKMLRVRKVTVMDISKKHGMEYRLLNAVIDGQPWYGNWGYKFGAGSFGITGKAYRDAIDTLSNLPPSVFFSHSKSPRTNLQNTVSLYSSLADKQLPTLRDLFSYISHLLQDSNDHQCRISSPRKNFPRIVSMGPLSSWSTLEIERAEEIMLKVLRAVGISNWVTWRALKGATSGSAGSPELLDYCLKGLGGKLTDDQLVVQSRFNDETNAIEFRLESYDQSFTDVQRQGVVKLPPDHLMHHLKSLYDGMLDPSTMLQFKPKETRDSILGAARKILDCKHFVKHYDEQLVASLPPLPNLHELRIWCNIELFDEPAYTSAPPELVILPANASMADLKLQAAKAFRETYIVFQRFQPEQVVGSNIISESKIKLIDENGVVVIRGRRLAGDGKLGRFRMERGVENWEVDCTCGARDDDGERMMACDVCGVWQHTRCAGINDQENVPEKFICVKCAGCYAAASPKLGDERGKGLKGVIANGRGK